MDTNTLTIFGAKRRLFLRLVIRQLPICFLDSNANLDLDRSKIEECKSCRPVERMIYLQT